MKTFMSLSACTLAAVPIACHRPTPCPAPLVVPRADQLVETYILRHEKTGEHLRIQRRDVHATLRQEEIRYHNNTIGMRYYDDAGLLTRISRTTTEGNLIEGQVNKQGNVLDWTVRDKRGALVFSAKEAAPEYLCCRGFRDDGILLWEDEQIDYTKRRFRMFHADGKTVHVEADLRNVFTSCVRHQLSIYGQNGKLLFREQITDPGATGPGNTYVGIIYPAAGKPTRRLISTDGQTSRWSASKLIVEDVAEDGTVTASAELPRGPYPYRAKLADSVLQKIVETKDQCHQLMVKGRHQEQFGRADLAGVLKN